MSRQGTHHRSMGLVVAWSLAVALVAGFVAVLAGPAAPAGAFSGSDTLSCRLYFGDTGEGISPSTYTDDFTLEVSPAAASVGDSVTITFTGSAGPRGGPVPLSPNSFAVVITLEVSGAQTSTLTFDNGVNDYPVAATGAFGFLGPFSTSTQFTPTAAGSLTFSLKQLKIDDGKYGGGSGANADTYCSGLPGDRDHKADAAASTTLTTPLDVDAGTCQNTTSPLVDELRTITVDGQSRSYYLSTPTTPAAESESLPIVFNLHGTGGNGLGGQISFMRAQGPQRGYVVVSPNATIRPGTTTTGWAKLGEPSPNEIAFLDAILADVRDVACIDDQRIFADGHSNGAIFSTDLACRWNRIAAIAPWSGVQSTNPARCSERPVPLLTTHGTDDEFTAYAGDSRPDPDLPDAANYQGSVTIDVDYWAFVTNQCDEGSRSVVETVPGVELTTYSGCAAETVLYTVIGGGHVAFSKTRTPPDPIDSAEVSLDFFDRQVRIDGPDYVPPPPPPVNLPPLFATVTPTLGISPAGPYNDGDEVTIEGSGFSAFRAVAVSICKRGKVVSGPGSCMFVDRSRLVNSDADGRFTTTLKVMVGTINASGDVCGPSDPCDFSAIALARACEITQSPVAFVGGPAPTAVPAAPGCPRLLLSDEETEPGTTITIEGVAFPPGKVVSLGTYFQWPAVGDPSSDVIEVTTDDEGEFTTTLVAPRISTGVGAFDGPPGKDSFLFTAARFLAPADVLVNPPDPNATPTPTPTVTPTPTATPTPSETPTPQASPSASTTPPPTVDGDTGDGSGSGSGDGTTSGGGQSGGALPATGGTVLPWAVIALALIQVALIMIVRSVRATPRRRASHA